MMHSLFVHRRFLLALLFGAVVAAAVPLEPRLRLLAGADAAFALFLGWVALAAAQGAFTAPMLRRHASADDPGMPAILMLGLLAAGTSLAAIFGVLAAPGAPLEGRLWAMLSVPLGWLTLHVMFAFRYAHLWYQPDATATEGVEGGGLDFPGTEQPGLTEFVYFSLTIGMCAQTSDVAVTSRAMRRAALTQAVIAFFYNAVLIALAVSAASAGS